MKAKYKKLIMLVSSALSLITAAAIILPSTSNFMDLMRAADTSVTDGNIVFSGSNTVKSSGTRTTVGRTVTGMPIVCKSTGNDTNAPQAYVAAMQSGTVISFFDSGNTEFEFQKVKGISITKAQEWGTLTYNFSYTLTDGTSGTTSTQPSHTTTGMVYYNLATICGGNLTKLSINCVSAVGNAYISDIVLTYDCGPVYLDSIDITTAPTKTSYYVGETFDPTGMVVTATYTSGSPSTVSGYTYSTSPLTLDDEEIEISYTEGGITKTATQEITVEEAPVLQSIAVTTAPTKTTYTEGDYFDPTGMVVTATYDKGPTRDVTAECTFSPDEETALTTSDTSVTISYGGASTTQAITVSAPLVLDHITISGQTTTFNDGGKFSFGSGVVTAHYTNGDEDTVTSSVSYHLDSAGGTEITTNTTLSVASYNGHEIYVVYTEGGITVSAHYTITVNAATMYGSYYLDARTDNDTYTYKEYWINLTDTYDKTEKKYLGTYVYHKQTSPTAMYEYKYVLNFFYTINDSTGAISIKFSSLNKVLRKNRGDPDSSYAEQGGGQPSNYESLRLFTGTSYDSSSTNNTGVLSKSTTPFTITISTYSSGGATPTVTSRSFAKIS